MSNEKDEALAVDARTGQEFQSMGDIIREGHRRIADMALEQAEAEYGRTTAADDARACRCPNRPHIPSLARDSSWALAKDREWEAQHGRHPYAKARDELVGALQHAEYAVRSGEAVLVMVADILGMPREVLQRALDAYAVPANS